jgi:hypothetical protein
MSRATAQAAETADKLVSEGVKHGRRAQKQLAKKTELTRKELKKSSKAARRRWHDWACESNAAHQPG